MKTTKPTTTAKSTMIVMIALPMTTKGCRALFDRRGGASMASGSSAVRGLRGVMRWASGRFESTGAALMPLTSRSEIGGYGSPATGTAFAGSRDDDERGGADSLMGAERPFDGLLVARSVVCPRGVGAAGALAVPFVGCSAALGELSGVAGGWRAPCSVAGLRGEAAAGWTARGGDFAAVEDCFDPGSAACAFGFGRSAARAAGARASAVRGCPAARPLPLGGGLDSVTAKYPLFKMHDQR